MKWHQTKFSGNEFQTLNFLYTTEFSLALILRYRAYCLQICMEWRLLLCITVGTPISNYLHSISIPVVILYSFDVHRYFMYQSSNHPKTRLIVFSPLVWVFHESSTITNPRIHVTRGWFNYSSCVQFTSRCVQWKNSEGDRTIKY